MIMKGSARFLMGLLVFAFMSAGVASFPAMGQEKEKAAKAEKGKVISTVIVDNDKVRVFENRFRPGDVNTSPPSSMTRVVRALKGGMILWTYADGKTETVEWKTGQVRVLSPGPQYTSTNIGKTEVVLYIVGIK